MNLDTSASSIEIVRVLRVPSRPGGVLVIVRDRTAVSLPTITMNLPGPVAAEGFPGAPRRGPLREVLCAPTWRHPRVVEPSPRAVVRLVRAPPSFRRARRWRRRGTARDRARVRRRA